MEIIHKGKRISKKQQKYFSEEYKIHNLRETLKNAIDEKNRIRSIYNKDTNYELLIYAHSSIYELAKKAYHKFDKRVVAVLPDIPSEIFAFRYGVPNIVKEALVRVQKYLDLRHLPKSTRIAYIKGIISRAAVDFPIITEWLNEFLLWYNDPKRYEKTSAGHKEVIIRLLEPNN